MSYKYLLTLIILLNINTINSINKVNAALTKKQILEQKMNNLCGTFEGTIGKYPITLHIIEQYDDGWIQIDKQKKYFSGWYYYNKYKNPIHFVSDKNNGDKIKLKICGCSEKFILSLKNDTLSGEWVSAKGEKTTVFAKLSTHLPQFDFYSSFQLFKYIDPSFKVPYKDGHSYFGSIMVKESCQLKYLNKIISNIIDPEILLDNPGEFLINKEKKIRDTLSKNAKDNLKYLKNWCNEYSKNIVRHVNEGNENPTLYQEIYINCCFLSKKICSIRKYDRYCNGGSSYPNYFYYSIDLINKKLLTIDDIIIKDKLNDFFNFYINYTRDIYKDDVPDDLDKGIEKKNFYITENSITFCNNIYQIACGAKGVIHINIPFKKIRKFLKPEFIKFLQKNS